MSVFAFAYHVILTSPGYVIPNNNKDIIYIPTPYILKKPCDMHFKTCMCMFARKGKTEYPIP